MLSIIANHLFKTCGNELKISSFTSIHKYLQVVFIFSNFPGRKCDACPAVLYYTVHSYTNGGYTKSIPAPPPLSPVLRKSTGPGKGFPDPSCWVYMDDPTHGPKFQKNFIDPYKCILLKSWCLHTMVTINWQYVWPG